jgi:hypothetical protein
VNGAPSAMVSPGLWGFVAFFVLALALYLLMRNMNARMRRMSYRSEELARQADEKSGNEKSGDEKSGKDGTTEAEPQDGDPAP